MVDLVEMLKDAYVLHRTFALPGAIASGGFVGTTENRPIYHDGLSTPANPIVDLENITVPALMPSEAQPGNLLFE